MGGRCKLGATGGGGSEVHREAVILDDPGEDDAIDVARLFLRLPAFEHVVEDASRVARQRVAIAASGGVAPMQLLTLLQMNVHDVRKLGHVAVVIDQMSGAWR